MKRSTDICPNCQGLIVNRKCVRCKKMFKTTELNEMWMKEFNKKESKDNERTV